MLQFLLGYGRKMVQFCVLDFFFSQPVHFTDVPGYQPELNVIMGKLTATYSCDIGTLVIFPGILPL